LTIKIKIMNNPAKFILALFICVSIIFGCSLITKLKEELNKEGTTEEVVKEETSGSESSYMDLEYYNKYIQESNDMSEALENVQNAYISNVPEPKSIKKSSLILVVMADTYLSFLDTELKDQDRSLNDGGELSKLEASGEMKETIEADYRDWMSTVKSYSETAKKVFAYYKNGDYKDDLSKAEPYDKEIQDKYKKCIDSYNKLLADLKKFKPEREMRDPDDYSNADEKSIVILENALYRVLDQADLYITEFKKNEIPNPSELKKQQDELQKVFDEESAKVMEAPFTDKSKYLKYSFEDYFSKMVRQMLESSSDLIKVIESGNTKDYKYKNAYDAVTRNYNYVIDAYNSSINSLNSFVVY
jgi:hypothetical protein